MLTQRKCMGLATGVQRELPQVTGINALLRYLGMERSPVMLSWWKIPSEEFCKTALLPIPPLPAQTSSYLPECNA